MTERSLPILCLDWDGVIHAYTSGWKGVDQIPDGPVPGAVAFIAEAVERFRVCIYSSRSDSAEGIEAMKTHLKLWMQEELGSERGFVLWQRVEWPTTKPPALVTLDDRALTFTGAWPSLDELAAFRPWNARGEPKLVSRYDRDKEIFSRESCDPVLLVTQENTISESLQVDDESGEVHFVLTELSGPLREGNYVAVRRGGDHPDRLARVAVVKGVKGSPDQVHVTAYAPFAAAT